MDSLLPPLPGLLVLSVLEDGPAHGYQISRRVEEISAGVLHLKEGTLYPRLYHLERQGLVRGQWPVEASGRRIRIYEITAEGHRMLAKDRGEWERRAEAAAKVLLAGRRPKLGSL